MTQNKRKQAFIGKLGTLFDIAHQDANKIMKSEIYNDENIAFLEDQRGLREMMMRVLDEKNYKKYMKSFKRKTREEEMKQKEQFRHNDKKIK